MRLRGLQPSERGGVHGVRGGQNLTARLVELRRLRYGAVRLGRRSARLHRVPFGHLLDGRVPSLCELLRGHLRSGLRVGRLSELRLGRLCGYNGRSQLRDLHCRPLPSDNGGRRLLAMRLRKILGNLEFSVHHVRFGSLCFSDWRPNLLFVLDGQVLLGRLIRLLRLCGWFCFVGGGGVLLSLCKG